MLTPHVVSHFPKGLRFVVAIMEQGCSAKSGHGLAELDKHTFLLGFVVRPKELVSCVVITYNQHSDEIKKAAARYTFDVNVYSRFSTRQFGRAVDIDFVFPECQSLQGKVPWLCWVPGSFGCPPRTECVGELM